MRLIDADALKEKMRRTNRYFDVKFDIDEAPTVDAVEVVRCKDCKHRFTHTCGIYYGTTNFTDFYLAHGDDFYCAYGERKEASE